MRKKLDSFQYQGLDDLEADFTLMVNNCLSYNERDTIFYRAGIKMRDAGGSILRFLSFYSHCSPLCGGGGCH
jgi:bromodomain and PHD finger-containing protein 1